MIWFTSTQHGGGRCQSTIMYERRETAQVLYIVPVSRILGRLPLVPVGKTGPGTILFDMRRESADSSFPGAVCDKTKNSSAGAGPWDEEPNNSGNEQ